VNSALGLGDLHLCPGCRISENEVERPKIILVVWLIFLIDFCVSQKNMVLESSQATCRESQHTNIEIVGTFRGIQMRYTLR
jgi:hypothetical protein